MIIFFDDEFIENLDYDHLPALVKKGEDREGVLGRIVDAWCQSYGVVHDQKSSFGEAIEEHVAKGGLVLDGVALWDETVEGQTDRRDGAPIDLGNLLRKVEERLRAGGAPEAFEQRPDLYILLRGCRVYRCDAYKSPIRPRLATYGVRFDDARFIMAKFGDAAHFNTAKFGDNANFSLANFGNAADFDEATFGDGARFFGTRFGDAVNFSFVRFGAAADFSGATFGDAAEFRWVTFGPAADFRAAAFGNAAHFHDTNLQGAELLHADLSRADLRDVRGLVLDRTRVRDAQFSPRSSDPWSVLRRAYTGPRLIFNLLFLIAFFLPYIARTGYWVGVNRTEHVTVEILNELRDYAEDQRQAHPHTGELLERGANAVERRVPGPKNPKARPSKVWRLVIGMDRGTWFWVSAVLLLIYNILRAGLTWVVAPMRDEEERSGVSPTYKPHWEDRPWQNEQRKLAEAHDTTDRRNDGPVIWLRVARLRLWWRQVIWFGFTNLTESYWWMIWPHHVARLLFALAVASFLWSGWQWMMLDVWLPPVLNNGPQAGIESL